MLQSFLKPIKRLRQSYLPGIVTASADDDPSTVSTFSVVGATTGFSQLWLLIISTPLLINIHRISARIGDVTRKGIITLVKEKYGRRLALLCVLIFVAANLLSLLADIVGMAAGFQLLTGENYIYFIVPLIILVWYVIVFDNYQAIAKYFFWFSGIILAYIVAGILARPDWLAVAKAIVLPPINFNMVYVIGALGLLGTSFSPYALFWQTEEEQEERRNVKDLKKSNRAVTLGFIYSNLVAAFIVISTASALSAGSVDLLTVKDIAKALTPVAGPWATKLFGIGLIGSGILAIPILAISSAYAVAELFEWTKGLSGSPSRAKGFYSVITIGFLLCLFVLLFELNPIRLIFYSQVLVGIITPVILYFILAIARDAKLMGQHRCRWLSLTAGFFTIFLLALGDVLVLYFLIK